MKYESALNLFLQTHPGVDVSTQAGQEAFNNWSGQTFGTGGFENAPEPNIGAPTNMPGGMNPTAVNIFGSADPSAALQQAIGGATINPNTQQVQGGQQAGFFQSAGGQTTTGTQEEKARREQQQTAQQQGTTLGTTQQLGTTAGQQQMATTGTTAGATTEDVTGRGVTTGTTQAVDTLGLGRLLAGQAGAATSADAARQAFLQGLVTQGPAQQRALTEAAVNQALSGPGMFGTGQGAQARAAGNAAAQVGLNALGQQLQAAQQLAGPSATTTLVGAGNPYVGQQTTGTTDTTQSRAGTQAGTTQQAQIGQQTGTTSQDTTSQQASQQASQANMLDISNLLKQSQAQSNETQSGTSGNVGYTAGIGTVPQNTQQSSGGCFACTAYVDMGWKMNRAIRAAAAYKLSLPKYRRSLAGYSVYGPALAWLILNSALFAKLFHPVAQAVLYEELRLAGKVRRRKSWASLCHFGFHYGSLAVAVLTGRREVKQCDAETVDLLKRNNLLMEV